MGYIGPSGETCATIQIVPDTGVVLRAYNCRLLAIVTPKQVFDIEMSEGGISSPTVESSQADGTIYTAPAGALRRVQITAGVPGFTGRVWRCQIVDAAGALADGPATPMTIVIRRIAIPGEQA